VSFRQFRRSEVKGTWTCKSIDESMPIIEFTLLSTGHISCSADAFSAHATCTKGNHWISSIVIRKSGNSFCRTDLHHEATEPGGITDELVEFCSGLIWSAVRAYRFQSAKS
jgi:hypothetical protein